MKLKSISIKYNPANYADWDGTPPNGYGGKIELETKVGTVGIILTENEIAAIVRVIAGKVAQDMVELATTVDTDVRNSIEFNAKAIEVEQNADALQAKSVAKHKFLMLGDTGTGTSRFLTLPGKKFIYCFDPNAILSLQGHDLEYEEFLPGSLNMSAGSLSKGKGDKTTNHQNQMYVEWEKDFDLRVKDGFFDGIDVIGLDSATTFQDLIMDRILTINGRAGQWPQQDDYGPQMQVFTSVMRTLNSLGKTIYVTGHMETKQDEATKRILRQPMMTGRLKTKIPLLFSDIFTTSAENDGQGNISYKIQTVPDRMTSTIRTSFKDLDPFEDVTIDWSKNPIGQGIGKFINE